MMKCISAGDRESAEVEDAEHDRKSVRQLKQHLRAFLLHLRAFLLHLKKSEQPLSEKLICDAHEILMKDLQCDGVSIDARSLLWYPQLLSCPTECFEPIVSILLVRYKGGREGREGREGEREGREGGWEGGEGGRDNLNRDLSSKRWPHKYLRPSGQNVWNPFQSVPQLELGKTRVVRRSFQPHWH